jgi:citrate lyase gamma subunit
MSRLIFVPQFPAKMRYQEFWFTEFPKKFNDYFDEIVVLGKNYIESIHLQEKMMRSDQHMFSPIHQSILMEMDQINEFYNMKINQETDFLFLSDLSFPGFFCNILHHKPIKNAYCYCHATSLNFLDYFEPVRNSKYECEKGHSKLFKKIFIGSNYHYHKLKWENTHVVGLPIPPYQTYNEGKIYDVISVARTNDQKVDKDIEDQVEKDFGEIIRKEVHTWEEYYKFLSQAKILLVTSKEDTFNYSIMEAVMNKTVVLAPNRLAFPELLKREFLYDNYIDLNVKIKETFAGFLKPQRKLLCNDKCENFFDIVVTEMLKGGC